MGFRFHRRLRLFPGVRLNFSKSGISTSIGRRGAWLTLGKRGSRVTVGLPGSGLSYTSTQAPPHADPAAAVTTLGQPSTLARLFRAAIWVAVIASAGWIAIVEFSHR